MPTGLEETMAANLIQAFGSPLFAGIGLLLFFVIMAVAWRFSLETSLVFLIPCMFLIFGFIPELRIAVAIIGGFIIAFALLRIFRR